MDFPTDRGLPTHISSYMSLSAGKLARGAAGLASSGVTLWSVANLALFYPLFVPWRYPVARAFWANGSSVTSSHLDIGLYTPGGAQIWAAGSTVQATTNILQYVSTGGVLLTPGWYYLAIAMDNLSASHAYGSALTTANARLAGIMQQASAFPLPASATFANYSQSSGVALQVCGITRTASGF